MRRLAVLALLASSSGHASEAPEGQPPRVASVRGSLGAATAIFSVRYLVDVEGPRAWFDAGAIALPQRGVATRATVTADGSAHELALLGADRADRELDELAARPTGNRPRWAASIRGAGAGQLAVTIAAPHAGSVAIDLEVQARTCFHRDVRYVLVPAEWKPALAPELRTRAASPAELAESCGFGGSPDDVWVGFPAPELARRAAGEARISAFAGRLALGDAHLVRVELDIAGKLGEVPHDLATAIVVDGSRSMTAGQIEAQRELVAAYLRAAPEARVQVIAYARDARALLPGWTIASHAATRVDRELRALAPRNGSNADAGLAAAARWLAGVHGTRRIVIVSDDRLAKRLVAMPLPPLVPAGILVHVAVAVDGDSAPSRDDSSTLGALAQATEGLAISTGVPKLGLDATLLVRPIAFDQLEIKAPGWKRLELEPSCGDTLAEGRACTWWGEGTALAGPIAIDGRMWNKRVVRVVRPDPALAVSVARDLAPLTVLEAAAQKQVEAAAHAVNESWTLFGSWGGPHGYGEELGRLSGASCCGGDPAGSGLHGFGTSGTGAVLPPLDLTPQLAGNVGKCGLGTRAVRADVETTLSEIVDVHVVVTPHDRAVATCVEDAIWDTAVQVPPRYVVAVSHVAFGG